MKKTVLLSLCLNLFGFGCVMGQSTTAFKSLDSIYQQLVLRPQVKLDSVKYTGDDFKKSGGFAWQRGKGTGWTIGCRLTLKSVAQDDIMLIRKNFEFASRFQSANLSSQNDASTYFNDFRTAFLYSYDSQSQTLYFLKATTDGEISVPYGWKTLNFMDASSPNPFAGADESELRLLGLSRLWAEVKRNFVFMERVRLDWDSLYVTNIRAMKQARNRSECFFILQRMAAQLNDGHTYVYGGDPRTAKVPISTVMIGNKVYVDAVESSTLSKRGLKRGMELVRVNGMPVLKYGEQYVKPYISSSTPQWTLHQTYEGSELLSGMPDDSLYLSFVAGHDTLSFMYVLGSVERDQVSASSTLELKKLDRNIGYLRIKDFMASNFKKKFDKLYPQILQTSALIIDLRNNHGGNSGNGDYILRHLSSDSIRTDTWRSPMYIPAYASWSMKQPWYNSPSGNLSPIKGVEIYTRPVVVLINGGTFSAAEDFCSLFTCMKRGKLIGTPTGGSTGNGVRVELIPGHTYANICSKHDAMPDGTEFVGIGIKPDIEVSENYDSYFKKKENNVLKAALKYLKSEL